jgi:hypothetical protein
MPFGPKFVGASELAVALHFKALCHSALMLTDGFISSTKPYELVKARRRDVDAAIAHLSSVQPGCDNPSWEPRPGGWFLHDYDDPIYANPLREVVRTLQLSRQKSASAAGKRSAQVRSEKYGTAQPPRTQTSNETPNDSFEPAFDSRSTAEEVSVERNPERPSRTPSNLPAMRSTTTDVHGDYKNVSIRHGDNALQVSPNGKPPAGPSPETQAVKLLDWLLVSRGSGSFASRDEQEQEHAIAVQLVGLGLPLPELLATLQGYRDAADPDEVGSSLKFYWMRTQDDAHDVLKQQQRPHARTDGLTKAAESLPDIKHTKGSKP